MAKNEALKRAHVEAQRLARAGREIPKAVLSRVQADAQKPRAGIDPEKLRLLREAAGYRRKLGETLDPKDPRIAGALAGLRGVAGKVAKRKVPVPVVAAATPGILAGSYTLRLTPAYDTSDGYHSRNAGNSNFANLATGEMGIKIFAEHGASVYSSASMGVLFVPAFPSGHLSVRVNPSISFAWWAISTGSYAMTLGLMALEVTAYSVDGKPGSGAAAYSPSLWFDEIGDQLGFGFDFGSSSIPMTVGLRVDWDHIYAIRVMCLAEAVGEDVLPNSMADAGGILNVALPYIDLDVQADLVATAAL